MKTKKMARKTKKSKGLKKTGYWERLDNKLLFMLTLIVKHVVVVLNMPNDFGGRFKACQNIYNTLYPSTWFPTPPVTNAIMMAAIAKYQNAAAAVKSGATDAEDLANEAWDELYTLIKRLRNYVQDICWANPAVALEIAHAAGMDVKGFTPKGKQNFAVKPKGSALELCGKVKSKCAGHEWGVTQNTTDPMGWYRIFIESTGRSKTLVYGLVPGQLYYFRHRCIMPTGCSDWDDIISFRIPDV